MSPAPDNTRQQPERTGYEMRLLIHHKVAGAIIGKGGENIKKLREYDIEDITIPDRQSPERIVIVLAKSLDSITKCLKDMQVKIDEVNKKVLGLEKSEARVLIHSGHGGAVIGKAGVIVKELKEKTGCTIKVFTEACPGSTDRVCAVQGERDGVVQCVTDIVRICRENPVKTMWRKYDAGSCVPQYAEQYGGFNYTTGGGISMGGDSRGTFRGGQGQQYGGGSMMSPLHREAYYGGGGGDMGGMRYGAPPAGHSFQSAMQQRKFESAAQSLFQSDWKAKGIGSMYGAMAELGYMNRGLDVGPKETVQLTVPEEVAGAVIGKGGSRIRQISEDSLAKVSLDRDSNVDGEKIITITGTSNQVQLATFLLQQAVRNSPQGKKLLGGGNKTVKQELQPVA